jgi:hypothetical protein
MIDRYLQKTFKLRGYNCWSLVRDFWRDTQGCDLGPVIGLHDTSKKLEYKKLEKPESPCIVLMLNPRQIPHVGVYWKGKVLHIKQAGAQYVTLPVATFGFQTVEYYKPCQQ